MIDHLTHQQRAGEIISLDNSALGLLIDETNGRSVTLLAGTTTIADLFVPSSCQAHGQPDFSYNLSHPFIHEVGHENEKLVTVTSDSTVWQKKIYSFRCVADRIEYFYTVNGAGVIDECEFFQGFIGQPHPGGQGKPWIEARYEDDHFGRVRSRPAFPRYFNPEPNGLRRQYFATSEWSTIGVRSDKSHLRGNWFFTPGPLCYVLSIAPGQWLAVGIAAKPGQNNFSEYRYHGGNGFGLSLNYEGQTRVDGTWESPHIIIILAHDEYVAVARYCDHLRQNGYVPSDDRPIPDWWPQPIFCGWGAQCHLARSAARPSSAPALATQTHYERFLAELASRGLNPGTVIVDDKWQSTYGDPSPDPAKWPDMAGFVARQHEAGRKVLLWLKAWDAEGIPPDECLRDTTGQPLAVDPTNANYETRLRRAVRRLLSEYGADGFKLDFTHLLPRVPGQGNLLWGMELLHHLLWIIHSEAKATKEDALIIAHSVNPYFADVVDMVRLNDVAIIGRDEEYAQSMVHRFRMARAVSKHWLVDMDNWPSPSLQSWLEYVRLQPELGVPSLYYTTHIDESGEAINEEQTKEISALWDQYRAKL